MLKLVRSSKAETVTDAAGEVSVGRRYSQALTLTSGQIFVIGGKVVLAQGNTAIVANVYIISETTGFEHAALLKRPGRDRVPFLDHASREAALQPHRSRSGLLARPL
jgi:hypothetical protein